MTVLVTGATGHVGRRVVERLVRAGAQVRAMTRRPDRAAVLPGGVDVVRGDLDVPSSLTAALRGVERMYLFPVAATAADVAGAAVAAGVRRIVTLSSGAVEGGYDTGFHLPVERAVEASGAAWTHVRPGEFMLNKLWLWGASIRAGDVVRDPYPDAAWCPVHEDDIADVAAAALLEDGHAGRAYMLNGPEFLTHREQVRLIGDAVGRDVRFERVTPVQARDDYRRQGGFAAENADFLLGFESYSGEPADPADRSAVDLSALGPLPTARDVTGRPARTFAQWARDHADDFRS
ncbi:NmrA family transcriptional regulator [Actinomadura sp. CNU-125]|uniref:SDR family oxidoreductase n=1 Tax=Actinomadura sp. CNU-125 TaxID=1904961 RepID=UPI00095E4BAC|nr:NAD(P)H-binding protein [Actinomadura sp. CNU-125]OLT28820.1 NmrA family transcriptional regulator [Actinomadura sp. CNU-125]